MELIPPRLKQASTRDLRIGAKRFEIFNRLVGRDTPITAALAAELCLALDLSERSVRELASRFKVERSAAALTPRPRGPTLDKFRCEPDVQNAILKLAGSVLLTSHPPSEAEAAREIRSILTDPQDEFRFQDDRVPDERTILRIFARITSTTKSKKQGSKTKTSGEPHPGTYTSSGALDIVQMDHTRGDAILVDRFARRELVRPWITLIIDIYTRVILGFYVSFGDPSIYRCGRAVANAILPKALLLARMGLDINYPMYGTFRALHADQAKPHKADSFVRACLQHGIDATIREPGTPNMGGHIERLIGTMVGKMRLLPGATGSNTTKRDGYDAGEEAAMTLPEFEKWLLLQIALYHITPHSGLDGRTPAHAWAVATAGRAIPEKLDPEYVAKQFLPTKKVMVHSWGVQTLHRRYWHESLSAYIGQTVDLSIDEATVVQNYVCLNGVFHTVRPYGRNYPDVSVVEYEASRTAYRNESREFSRDGGDEKEIARLRHTSRRLIEASLNSTKISKQDRRRAELEGTAHGDKESSQSTVRPEPVKWLHSKDLPTEQWLISRHED